MAGREGKGKSTNKQTKPASIRSLIPSGFLPTVISPHLPPASHPGHPLPEAAAAELHPDVPSEPRPGAGDEGAECGAGEQGHGRLRGSQWQQRHPL